MVTEVDSVCSACVCLEIENTEEQAIARTVQEVVCEIFENCGEAFSTLDPARVTNALEFVITQIETMQKAEQIFLLSFGGGDLEELKDRLLEFKDNQGALPSLMLEGLFAQAVDDENVELINFMMSEFEGRIDFEEYDLEAVLGAPVSSEDCENLPEDTSCANVEPKAANDL